MTYETKERNLMSSRHISPQQFGHLYHGGSMQGAEVVDQSKGGHRYNAMPGTRGFNYATTSFETAKTYAQNAANADTRNGAKHAAPSVYQVTPSQSYTYTDHEGKKSRGRYKWGVDEHSGPNGYNDNNMSKSDALELSSYGDEGGGVALKFESPLKAKEIWSEDRAKDITPYDRSFT